MADNPKKRGKPDRQRVALKQDHERSYLIKRLEKLGATLYKCNLEIANLTLRLKRGAQ